MKRIFVVGTNKECECILWETATAVDEFTLRRIPQVSDEIPVSREALVHLPKIRAGTEDVQPKLRATMMRLVFEAFADSPWERIVPLAAA